MAFYSKAVTQKSVRIAVVGDRGTGKSTLIAAMASESFPAKVPAELPPTRLSKNSASLLIIDTPSSVLKQGTVVEELKQADVVVLTYACDNQKSFDRLSSYWLPELQRLEVKAPVIVVGCKFDLRDESQLVSLESLTIDILQQFREVVTCIECSAATLYQVPEVFYFAQKAVLHPVDPLFDYERNALTDGCIRALRRIFFLCDQNMDGALSDVELNKFQVKCFGGPLEPSDIAHIKSIVEHDVPEGVNSSGLTFPGFIYVHNMFLKKGRPEAFWSVLRMYGYGNDLKLRDDILAVPPKQASDQSVELTGEAIEFLHRIFRFLDTDEDLSLRPAEVDKLFGAAPECPWWNDAPYKDAAEEMDKGYIPLGGYISQWVLLTLLDPSRSLANLLYIGYHSRPTSALHVTRRRSEDRKNRKTERKVFQCYVFGSKKAGKSALRYSLLGRPFSNNYTPTTIEQYTANTVPARGSKKYLIMREIPEDEVSNLLLNQDYLAACDVAAFVYDSSDEYSWKKSIDLLEKVVNQGEVTGNKVPCLIIAAKNDLTPFQTAVLEPAKVTQELGIDSPIHVSMKSGDSNDLYKKILNAALHPHLNLPETKFVRKRKQQQQLLSHSLIFALVGAVMAVAGLTVRRGRAGNKNSSA